MLNFIQDTTLDCRMTLELLLLSVSRRLPHPATSTGTKYANKLLITSECNPCTEAVRIWLAGGGRKWSGWYSWFIIQILRRNKQKCLKLCNTTPMNIAEQVINYVNLILRPPPRHLYICTTIYTSSYVCIWPRPQSSQPQNCKTNSRPAMKKV